MIIQTNSQENALEHAAGLINAVKFRKINIETDEGTLVTTKDKDDDWFSKNKRILWGTDPGPGH